MAIKYVDEFEFPKESGFTESTPRYAKGGAVKQSPQFRMKTTKQDSMDHGVQPARKGRTQQEIEAGGTKKLRPKFAKGGRAERGGGGKAKSAHDKMYKEGGKMGYGKGGRYAKGGITHGDAPDRNRPSESPDRSQGEGVKATGQRKAYGGAVKGLMKGARKIGARNTVTAKKGQGEGVKPAQKGRSGIGKGGKTGAHRYAKGGRMKYPHSSNY